MEGINRMIKMQKMGLLKEKNGNKFIPDPKSGAESFPFNHHKKSNTLLVEDVQESVRYGRILPYRTYLGQEQSRLCL